MSQTICRYRGERLTRAEVLAAVGLDVIRIPWRRRPRTFLDAEVKAHTPAFQLWPDANHPWYLDVTDPTRARSITGELPGHLANLRIVRHECPDALLMLWFAANRSDWGLMLVGVPGGDWVTRNSQEFLRTAASVHPLSSSPRYRPPWWRRFLLRR